VFADCTSRKCIRNVAFVRALCLRELGSTSALQGSETTLLLKKRPLNCVDLDETADGDIKDVWTLERFLSFVVMQEDSGVSPGHMPTQHAIIHAFFHATNVFPRGSLGSCTYGPE